MSRKGADINVVLDNQHPASLAHRRRLVFTSHQLLSYFGRAFRLGEKEGKSCAPANLAFDRDLAPRLLGEAVDLGQTEAGALADFLRCIKRLEDLGLLVSRDACPRIADRDSDVAPRLAALSTKRGQANDALDSKR